MLTKVLDLRRYFVIGRERDIKSFLFTVLSPSLKQLVANLQFPKALVSPVILSVAPDWLLG